MTKLEIVNRLKNIDAEILAADNMREGDMAADLQIEKGELEATLSGIEMDEEIEANENYESDFDDPRDC